jgi:anhydro-N-acetylmuramic acid kinase
MSEQVASALPSSAASILAIGLMSGTSQDGVDVALIDTDGERIAQLGATAAAANLTDRARRPAYG